MNQSIATPSRTPSWKLPTAAGLLGLLSFVHAGCVAAGCVSAASAVTGQITVPNPALTFESVPQLVADQEMAYTLESHPASFSVANGVGLFASGGQTDLKLVWYNNPRLFGGCESSVTIDNFALIVPGSSPDVPLLSIRGKISARATEYGRCPNFPPFDDWSHATLEGLEVSVDGIAVSVPANPSPNTVVGLSGRLSGATLTLNERTYSGGAFAITSLRMSSSLDGLLVGDVSVAATRVNAVCGTPVSLQSFSVD